MSVSVSIDATRLNRMIRELQRMSNGRFLRPVLQQVAANALSTAVRYSPQAKRGAENKAARHIKAKHNTFAGPGRAGSVAKKVAGVQFAPATGIQPRISVAPNKGNTWLRQDNKWH